ncbi:unnamed protein product [Closterium sp. NIES-54]
MVVVLEQQLHAVKINEGDAVQGAFDRLRDLYVKLFAAGVDYPEKINPSIRFRRKELTAAAGEGGVSAYGMKGFKRHGNKKGKAKEGSVGEQYSGGKRGNKGGKRCGGKYWYCHVQVMGEGMGSEEGNGGAGGHGGMFYHVGEACSEDMVVPASKVALHCSSYWVIDTGAFMTMTNREDLLDEVRPSKAATVVSAIGQVVPMRGEGRAMFMGADGRLVGLKRVLLVIGLCANLLSTKALSGKDMHRSMWEIPVLPWKEAAARLAAEAVRGGHASHVTSGGGGDGSDGGLIVHGGDALTSVTPSTGETDWLTAHRRFGHVALPQLQQLFKEERVKWLRIKGEPKENRVLTHVGGQHWVPMEKWSGKNPLLDMLRVFGCMGLVHVPKEKHDKLQAVAVWAVHLGLARGSKGWLMWDPKSNTIFTTRDAKFIEGLMFKGWSERGRSKVTIPLGIEVGTNDPLLIPIELSSSSELTEVSHDLGCAEGEAADVEGVLQNG